MIFRAKIVQEPSVQFGRSLLKFNEVQKRLLGINVTIIQAGTIVLGFKKKNLDLNIHWHITM